MSEYGRVSLPENSKAFLEAEIVLRERDLFEIEKRLNKIASTYYRNRTTRDVQSRRLEEENEFLVSKRTTVRLELEEFKQKLKNVLEKGKK